MNSGKYSPFNDAIFLSFLFSYLCIYSVIHSEEKQKYDLVICAVFQDESFFLKEWLEFHKLQGVQHFYLYDNLSSDPYYSILRPYIESGEVELFHWPAEAKNQADYLNLVQLPVYNHALSITQGTSRWVAFLDLDEFLFSVKYDTLTDLLRSYEEYAALGVNWQVFGTSWIDRIPENGLITEHLLYKAPTDFEMNRVVKLIVQPHRVQSIRSPHFFEYQPGYFAVDSLKRPLSAQIEGLSVLIDTVRINHYWCGTYDWLVHNKIPRREKWGYIFSKQMIDEIVCSFNQIIDTSILHFIPALRLKVADY